MINDLHRKLESFYNPSLFDYKSNGGIVCITEHEPGAKVKKADVIYQGQLLVINNCLLSVCHNIYEDNGQRHPELRHDCDGILLIKNRGGKYLIFIELKSKYSEENIIKAEKQLAASYIRVLSRLSCIEGFNVDEYKKCGIIVSYAPNTKELNKNDKKQKQNKSLLSRYEKQMRAFLKDKGRFELDKCFVSIGHLPIRRDLIFDTLPIFHINVSDGSPSVQFNLDDILKSV